MRPHALALSVLLSLLLASAVLAVDNYTGTYVMQTQAGPLTLTLMQDAKGHVTGTLSSSSGTLRLDGIEGEGEVIGSATDGKTKAHFEAELEGSELQILFAEIDTTGQPNYAQAQEMTFTRTSTSASAMPKHEPKHGKGAKKSVPPPAASQQDQQLAQLLLSSPWCSFSYSQSSGRTSTSRNTFSSDGTLRVSSSSEGGTVNQSGGSSVDLGGGASGSLYSQHTGGGQVRWKVEKGQLWLDEGNGFQAMAMQISRNSNGYPIIKASGTEYMQCK
jgi:hypothetical protein